MMKKKIIVPLLLFAGSMQAQKVIVIKGTFTGDTKGYQKIYMYGKGVKGDSAVMTDGSFEFKVPFEKPFMPLFYTEYDKSVRRMYAPFPLLIETPGTVTLSEGQIEKGMNSFKVTGMQSAMDYESFRMQHQAIYQKVNGQLEAKYGKAWLPEKDPMAAALQKDRNDMAREGLTRLLAEFVSRNPDSYAAALALSSYGRDGLSPEELKKNYDRLSKKRRESEEGKTISGYIAGVNNSAIGKKVADFTLNTPEEKPFSFSQLKGKYVVIDFWASWCGPCIKSFPHMKEVYKKYRSDQFEIYSISIDTNKEAWLKGVKEQQLPWMSTLDTRQISQSGFAVTAVPTTFLIGPDGTILLKEVGFEPNGALEKKLEELLGKKML